MPKVKYVGTSNVREISAADWKSVDVEDQDKVVWDRDNKRLVQGGKQVQEISDAAWEYLQSAGDSKDFVLVEDSAATGTGSTTTGRKPKP